MLTSMNTFACAWKGQGWQAEALDLMKDCAQQHPYTVSSLSVEWLRRLYPLSA